MKDEFYGKGIPITSGFDLGAKIRNFLFFRKYVTFVSIKICHAEQKTFEYWAGTRLSRRVQGASGVRNRGGSG